MVSVPAITGIGQVMNTGWYHYRAYKALLVDTYGPQQGYDELRSFNMMARGFGVLYECDWLSDVTTNGRSNFPLNIISRATGIRGVGGDFEFIMINPFSDPTAVDATLMLVHTDPGVLRTPEPNLFYIRIQHAAKHNHNGSERVELYNPVTRQREKQDATTFWAMVETITQKAEIMAEKHFDTQQHSTRVGHMIRQAVLLATFFAHTPVMFETILALLAQVDDVFKVHAILTEIVKRDIHTVPASMLVDLFAAGTEI